MGWNPSRSPLSSLSLSLLCAAHHTLRQFQEKRMKDWRDQTREKRQKTEPNLERMENRERMDARRSRGRDEKYTIEWREENKKERERMEMLRSRGRGREENQRTESSGHRRDKRQRSEKSSGDMREKRQRTEDHREDKRRHWAELDVADKKRRNERVEVERTEEREKLGQTPTESSRESPKSISDLNRIYGGLREGKDGVGRKKTFQCMEEVHGRKKNILQGLELHSQVFDPHEQKKITNFVYGLQRLGQEGRLKRHTYSAPKKWMRGKGRVTLQFGCCYNYAKDKEGNPPGIMRNAQVDQMPPLLKDMICRMVKLRVLPATCVPDSCIINIYDKGDCIPPHIDHKDFLRPFCTVSFLSEAKIVFGQNLNAVGPGEFTGSASIPLPCGSVLVLSGNGADVAKHSVPSVRSKRISITFRKKGK